LRGSSRLEASGEDQERSQHCYFRFHGRASIAPRVPRGSTA
jgi:hypothetical protein